MNDTVEWKVGSFVCNMPTVSKWRLRYCRVAHYFRHRVAQDSDVRVTFCPLCGIMWPRQVAR